MDIFLIVLGGILCLVAIIGSLLPILPGPLFAYIACILFQMTSYHPFSRTFFIVWALIIGFLTVLDYLVPARGTKKFGGTKWGIRGSNIGLLVAVIILPILGITIGPFGLIGLIGGPFLGAYFGEKLGGQKHNHALRSAWGSFIGFVTGSLLKLIVSVVMAGYFFRNLYTLVVR